MGTLTKKLHILKSGGTEETCNIYTTPEEVGGSPYLALEVDGQKGYVKLGSTTDANATHLRVEKNGTTYAAWKSTGEHSFIVTAEYQSDSGLDGYIEYGFSYCGLGDVTDPNDNKRNFGSIAPQEIDGFKIIAIYDFDYNEFHQDTGDQSGFSALCLEANRKCILHIKGKDYKLINPTTDNNIFTCQDAGDAIGIKDKEQIKVTYTLL